MEEPPVVVDLSYESRSPSKRSFEEDLDVLPEGGKRVKMRHLDSVLKFGGIKKCSTLTEGTVHSLQSKEEISHITDTIVSLHSDKHVRSVTSNIFAEPTKDISLTLGLVESIKFSENPVNNDAHTKSNKERGPQNKSFAGLSLDLNDNPFNLHKNLEPLRSTDASECGSTTGTLEESEPLKMWKEMKQNGFLSSSHGGISHGGIPVPKQRSRQPKRKKEEEFKKKSEIMTKREQPNKYTKNAAPTGLLSGLNPGIIKHVRNSKQVNSIIEAMLKSERSDKEMHNRPPDQIPIGSKDVTAHNSAGNQFSLYYKPSFLSGSDIEAQIIGSGISGRFYNESSNVPTFNPQYDDDSLALKLSSAVTMASENTSSISNQEQSSNHDAIASLSLKGASVASQWLELLHQDIKGRLAALRRSKKRVRNVIQTELPYLLSKEMLSNQENEGFAHSSENDCSKKAILDMHMARWKSIFSQMDKALYEEGKHLENWLKQVQDMQAHCDGGLKYFSTNRSILLADEFSGLKKTEAAEKEKSIRAAAASIYSTSNFILTKENVPCF
ncbi:uncharacterized protein A4U43_C07F5280 [Asparagus officinalis]|uniref:Uncharacterized protein n=1 Tax=Asparagus officinalis TaxID=4686 RepID=A0A5P1E9M6_ASPOF|nr:uncharacterized protein LOC109849193 [Asparagus officinalis]ONK62552.1 uncharacterized protein A4U43_C07F5280 [Asparagus officinalis]